MRIWCNIAQFFKPLTVISTNLSPYLGFEVSGNTMQEYLDSFLTTITGLQKSGPLPKISSLIFKQLNTTKFLLP